jgi:transglutaminase-like putative cysteine protease
MKFLLSFLITFLFGSMIFAQNIAYSSASIPDSLKQNANAVVRLDQIDIIISSQRNMNIKQQRIVTVLNEKGQEAIDAYEYYDKKTSVESIQATVLDAFGNEIKKIKRKDFSDQCATDGGTVFSDNRYLFVNYTPIQYPFTIIYESEIETSTTAFIPQWFPLNDYQLSVEKSILNVSYPEGLGFKKKEMNFSNFKINRTVDNSTKLSYIATNIPAQKQEDYSPSYSVFPKVMMALELFHLEDVDGNAKSWKEYGQWYSDKILTGTTNLPEETKAKIIKLVGDEKDPIKKAAIVYKYVQGKSRYVSIQVGIGGWKPMLANDVDRLGYGDCKALSNYTKALLIAVDVPSYVTLLYGDSNKHDIQSDFVSMQGNHMILSIPNGNNYIFLECTSQDDPFGYQANFTDDRDVLIIKPDGGEIIRTKNYENKDNAQSSKGDYSLTENGDLLGKIVIVSKGSQYGQKFHLETTPPTEKEKYYKEYWDNISNLKINQTSFSNDKEKISFTENIAISATNYGKVSNGKMIFVVDAYNQYTGSVKRIRNRKNPFEIQRGYYDEDEIAIALPAGFSIESIPNNFELNTKYGEYKTEIIKKDNSNLIYKRTLYIKKGLYKNTEYDEYRNFMEQISKNDNAKIILTKIQ